MNFLLGTTMTFEAGGPTTGPAPCTSPNIGPATVAVAPVSAAQSMASVTIERGGPGWYCFLDISSGDSHYTSATDNSTATGCLDVTASTVDANGASSHGTLATRAGTASTRAAPSALITGASSAVSNAVEARRYR